MTHTRIDISARQGRYPVLLHEVAGPWLHGAVLEQAPGGRIAIITDVQVAAQHEAPLRAGLEAGGRQVFCHRLPIGEASKSLEAAAAAYDALLLAGLDRNDTIVALGGGVVGDLAGFVAATYLRGIGCVQVPTSTLAALDASVGGKTALNTPRGKNLIGTITPPSAVLICIAHLATQSRRQHAAGLVEALKIGLTHDAELFAEVEAQAAPLLAWAPAALSAVLARAIALKAAVVGRDEFETGERAVLNFGHTAGHAIEAAAHYQLLHGEAVALGMLAEMTWAVQSGLSPQQLLVDLQQALAALEAPTQWREVALDRSALRLDKKRCGHELILPVVTAVGQWTLKRLPSAQLEAFLAPP